MDKPSVHAVMKVTIEIPVRPSSTGGLLNNFMRHLSVKPRVFYVTIFLKTSLGLLVMYSFPMLLLNKEIK